MSNLVEITKGLQRELGVEVDGVAGLVTLGAALATLRALRMDHDEEKEGPPLVSKSVIFDPRTERVLETLDPKAVPVFRQFLCLAKATAATLGCDYVLIAGSRTWAEQDALFAKGGVTKARGGYSNHNFGIAADAGVFLGKSYLDDGSAAQRELASKVHRACSMHAAPCGLAWGGNWKSFVDQPHYEMATGLSMAEKRRIFKQKGSVL